jgi:hypothetical protein
VLGPAGSAPHGFELIEVPADEAGFARTLYASLREADVRGYEVLVVALPATTGLGLAVIDRLRRAAAPR